MGIQTQFNRRARVSMWMAGIPVVLLAATGIVAGVRSIPASHAGIPDEEAQARIEAPDNGSGEANAGESQTEVSAGRAAVIHRNSRRCDECGVVESMRRVERYGDVSGEAMTGAEVAGGDSGGASARGAASVLAGNDYQFTVRFRDGTTSDFNEASPRQLRLGSRVLVIGRSNDFDR